MAEENKDIYVGSSKVLQVINLNDNLVEVDLLDPQGVPPKLHFTKDQFESVKSDTPYSDGEISIRKWKRTIAKMLTVLLEDNLEMGDMGFVLGRLRDSLTMNADNAVAKKFNVKHQDKISLQMIDEVLKSN